MENKDKKPSKLSNAMFYVLIGAMTVWLLAENNWIAAFGWLFSAAGWWAFDKEKNFYDKLLSFYKNHLCQCEAKEDEYKREIAALKRQLAVQNGYAKLGDEASK